MARSSTRMSSLYTSGQCLLSVLGSIGVILLFAGIPQLIYASHVSAGSLLTFLLGALLITLMVTGNAFIGYKYRQLIRDRREGDSRSNSFSGGAEDKPPSYDDLIKQEELPPSYAAVTEKPPRYEDYINEVYNWEAARRVSKDFQCQPCSSSSNQDNPPPSCLSETPIIVPLHKQARSHRFQRQKAIESIPEDVEDKAPSGEATPTTLGIRLQVEGYSYTNPSFNKVEESETRNGTSHGNKSLTQQERRKLFFNPSFENQTIEEASPEDSPTNGPSEDVEEGQVEIQSSSLTNCQKLFLEVPTSSTSL